MGPGRHDRFGMRAESRSQKHDDAEKEARVDGHKDARAQYQEGSDHCPVSCDPLTQIRPEAPCPGRALICRYGPVSMRNPWLVAGCLRNLRRICAVYDLSIRAGEPLWELASRR
jgi:hypothetical protein